MKSLAAFTLLGALLGAPGLSSPARAASVDGAQFEVSYLATTFGLLAQTYLTAPSSTPLGANFYVEIAGTEFRLGSIPGGLFETTRIDGRDVTFNGFVFNDYADQAPDFTAATLTSFSGTGATPILSFLANELRLNLRGVRVPSGIFAIIDVDPAAAVGATDVPAPAAAPLLAAALGGLALLRRRARG